MSQHAIESTIPQDFDAWKMSTIRWNGRQATTARRNGVTFVLIYVGGWWHVDKIKGGIKLESYTVKKLPERVFAAIEPSFPPLRRRVAA